ncbi:hypothetical protein RND81_09G137200 [Saponaria officinalis]|uniref:Uncharacterized protein n=1 Tax=Saponaria officinalis TaxID=3572 RepID=A0AAW1ILM2_SAPOF
MASEQAAVQLKRVIAIMANKSQNEMYCERYINWSGAPGPFPPPINADGVVEFSTFGTKGAVLYNGPPDVAKYQSAWLLAWNAPGLSPGPAPNKVYVTCGTKTDIDNITDKEILERLEASSSESKDSDAYTRTFVTANIKGLSPIDPVIGAIGVTFGTTA